MPQYDPARVERTLKACEHMLDQLDIQLQATARANTHPTDKQSRMIALYDRKFKVIQLMACLSLTELPPNIWERITDDP